MVLGQTQEVRVVMWVAYPDTWRALRACGRLSAGHTAPCPCAEVPGLLAREASTRQVRQPAVTILDMVLEKLGSQLSVCSEVCDF